MTPWAEEFFPLAAANNITFDVIVIHSYTTGLNNIQNVQCFCNSDQLRDELSHIRFKFGLPIWLTEFNCGNGYWTCPDSDQTRFMAEALPVVESHPWIERYSWMSALANEGAMNNATDYSLNELGQFYNNYNPNDAIASQNPQWTQVGSWTGRWREVYEYCDVFENPCENDEFCVSDGFDNYTCENNSTITTVEPVTTSSFQSMANDVLKPH